MAEKNPNFASLTYFSDHGEDIVTQNYHDNFNNKHYNQVGIPLIMILIYCQAERGSEKY